jgi:hypothetical protein
VRTIATPDTKHSIVVYKQGNYRGGTKRTGNRYHFEGALPTTPAAWEAFADLIVTAEKAIHNTDVTIVEVVGYDAGSSSSTNPHGDAVFTKTYTTVGTRARSLTGTDCPGDCASIVRYSTGARTTKNHPVYLMNYYHGAEAKDANVDELTDAIVAALGTYADHWVTGFTCEGSPRERCGPRGAVATGYRVDPYVRHRDFPS